MPLSLKEYRTKLTNKILFTDSKEGVTRYINAAMKALKHKNVNGHIVARFVDNTIGELSQFSCLDKDSQQWNNIQVAKIHFNLIRQQINATRN